MQFKIPLFSFVFFCSLWYNFVILLGDNMSTNFIKVANFMQKLAYDAERIIRRHKAGATHATDKAGKKVGHDIVTDIDLMIEKHCIEKIKRAYPQATLVSEEFNSDSTLTDSCFVIDPIDGTKNFFHGLPFWGFQIAYVEHGEVVASVINVPALHYFVKAIKGVGTFVNGKKVVIKPISLEHSLWLVDGNRVKEIIWLDLYRDCLGARSLGCSSVTYTFLLAGKISGIINRMAPAWDVLPGYFACENAGLHCVTLKNGIQVATVSKELLDYATKKLDVPLDPKSPIQK